MPKCLKKECPHYKEYEPYLYCKLIKEDIDGKECKALLIKDKAIEKWVCKIAKYQSYIDYMNELEKMFKEIGDQK